MTQTITGQITALEIERQALAQKAGAVGALSAAEQERLKTIPKLIASLFAQKRAAQAAGDAERTDYRRAGTR